MSRVIILITFACATGCTSGSQDSFESAERPVVFKDIAPLYPPITGKEIRDDSVAFAVILDPGHGGPNAGTRFSVNNIAHCEDEIALDIALRLIREIHSYNRASLKKPLLRGYLTVQPADKKSPVVLGCDGNQEVFIHPDNEIHSLLPAGEGGLAERARTITAWYNALIAGGFAKGRIALLSIHIDYAKQRYQGAFMLYPGFVYAMRKEKGESRNLMWQSMMFGTHLMYGLQRTGVQLHRADENTPMYLFRGYIDYYNQKKGRYEPGRLAIFRDTPPMPKILLEAANARHPRDQQRLLRRQYREKIASGLLIGILDFANLPRDHFPSRAPIE